MGHKRNHDMTKHKIDGEYYSQFGEDKIISKIFLNKPKGLCVEVGANNGVDGSTTFYFEKIGWKCILVEANPSLCQELRSVRSNSVLYECAASDLSGIVTFHIATGSLKADTVSTVSTNKNDIDRIKTLGLVSHPVQVKAMTLDDILSDAQVTDPIDFVSIDVEGYEYEVISGFSLSKWKPTILMIEDNSIFKSNKVTKCLGTYGYVRFFRTGVNDWYAHRSNRQLVNARSRTWATMLVIAIKIKSGVVKTLKGVPFVVGIRDYFRKKRPVNL
jgi:FkbM family methyltransferase